MPSALSADLREHVDVQARHKQASKAGTHIMGFVRGILSGCTVPQASLAQYSYLHCLRQEAPWMP